MYKLIISFAITAVLFQSCKNKDADETTAANTTVEAVTYVCLPCGQDCDSLVLNAAGTCKKCHMQLVKKSTILFNTVLPQDLYAHIAKTGSSNVLLLDVRTEAEFNGTAAEKFGRLKNAINIPVKQLEKRLPELEPYKQKEIIVYCSHSHRSLAACYLLTQKGFGKVTNLQLGMHRWKELVTDQQSNDSLYESQQR